MSLKLQREKEDWKNGDLVRPWGSATASTSSRRAFTATISSFKVQGGTLYDVYYHPQNEMNRQTDGRTDGISLVQPGTH